MGVSINGGTPKWMVDNGKSYWNGWFGGTPILGNLHIHIYIYTHTHCSVQFLSISCAAGSCTTDATYLFGLAYHAVAVPWRTSAVLYRNGSLMDSQSWCSFCDAWCLFWELNYPIAVNHFEPHPFFSGCCWFGTGHFFFYRNVRIWTIHFRKATPQDLGNWSCPLMDVKKMEHDRTQIIHHVHPYIYIYIYTYYIYIYTIYILYI